MPATLLISVHAKTDHPTDKPKQTKQPVPRTPRSSLLEPALGIAKSA